MTGLQAGCPRRQGSISGRGNRLLSFPSVHTGSGAHPASCQMDTGGSFPWVKVARGEGMKLITHLHLLLPLTICEAIPTLCHITVMEWCSIKHKGTSTLYDMIFIYCNLVSTLLQWLVDLYKNRRETAHREKQCT